MHHLGEDDTITGSTEKIGAVDIDEYLWTVPFFNRIIRLTQVKHAAASYLLSQSFPWSLISTTTLSASSVTVPCGIASSIFLQARYILLRGMRSAHPFYT